MSTKVLEMFRKIDERGDHLERLHGYLLGTDSDEFLDEIGERGDGFRPPFFDRLG